MVVLLCYRNVFVNICARSRATTKASLAKVTSLVANANHTPHETNRPQKVLGESFFLVFFFHYYFVTYRYGVWFTCTEWYLISAVRRHTSHASPKCFRNDLITYTTVSLVPQNYGSCSSRWIHFIVPIWSNSVLTVCSSRGIEVCMQFGRTDTLIGHTHYILGQSTMQYIRYNILKWMPINNRIEYNTALATGVYEFDDLCASKAH